MSQNPDRLIFIHGAWAGGWVWDPIIKCLNNLGVNAYALELPGNGFHNISLDETTEADLHQEVHQAIEETNGKVVLVGHSGGGMLITAAIEQHPQKVIEDDSDYGVTPFVVPTKSALGSTVPRDIACQYFFNDVELSNARLFADRLTPQPNVARRVFTQTSSYFQALPKLYLQATNDQSVVHKIQEHMCLGVDNLTIERMKTGHYPHISQTKVLANILYCMTGQLVFSVSF